MRIWVVLREVPIFNLAPPFAYFVSQRSGRYVAQIVRIWRIVQHKLKGPLTRAQCLITITRASIPIAALKSWPFTPLCKMFEYRQYLVVEIRSRSEAKLLYQVRLQLWSFNAPNLAAKMHRQIVGDCRGKCFSPML